MGWWGRIQEVLGATSGGEGRLGAAELRARISAIEESTATIEFEPDGTILHANSIFLGAMGYRLDQIVGKKHRIFCTPELANSAAYAGFWQSLAKGQSQSGEFERVKSDGSPIWIEGQYNPLVDSQGRVFKVVKYASDVTSRKQSEIEAVAYRAQIEAIASSMAFIEFEPSGVIRTANDIFLSAMGYRLDEIQGKHHRIFVDADYGKAPEYTAFWDDLRRGRNHSGEFERRKKDGDAIWIEGRYNALKDEDGTVFRVVKYASDVTDRKRAQETAARVNKELYGSAEYVRKSSESLIHQAEGAAAATGRTLARVEEVTGFTTRVENSTLEMSDGLASVARTTKELSAHMENVVSGARETSDRMQGLRLANDEISRVSDSISQIADQTNLLALNATIEAASAGDAGRGFAVVASEVKDLATETMRATDTIRAQVAEVQARSTEVADALEQINQAIDEASSLTNGVSGGMEEQSRMTSEIAASVAEVSEGARSIEQDMTALSQDAEKSDSTAKDLRETSDQLLRLARQVAD